MLVQKGMLRVGDPFLAGIYSGKVRAMFDERGNRVNGRTETPNEHDILTGSRADGTSFAPGPDATCKGWTSSSDGAAIVGHHDRIGLKDTWHMKSWNSSHGSRGCSQDHLKASGGAGLFYCFAANQ